MAAVEQPPATVPPPAAEVDLRAFIVLVDRITADIGRAEPGQLTPVLAAIPTRLHVNADEQSFDAPFEPLARQLAGVQAQPGTWSRVRPDIERQLRAIRAEAVRLLTGTARPAGRDPQAALAAILARQEFARAVPSDWAARLRSRIIEWLLALWDRLGGSRLDTDRVARVLVWLSTLAAIAGLVAWFHRRARRRIAITRDAAIEEVSIPASGWGLQALAAINTGCASEAVRFGYRAAVTRLAELGVWRVDDARTAREYVTLLAGVGARDSAFRDIAGAFERVVYANRAATPDDLGRLVDHLETLGCVRPHERAI